MTLVALAKFVQSVWIGGRALHDRQLSEFEPTAASNRHANCLNPTASATERANRSKAIQ